MGGPEMARKPQRSDTPRGTRGRASVTLYSQLGQLGLGGLAGLRIPAGHLVVGLTRGEELGGIDAGPLEGAVADPFVQPLRQDGIRRSEALAVVEQARQRVVALAHLHQLVEAQ